MNNKLVTTDFLARLLELACIINLPVDWVDRNLEVLASNYVRDGSHLHSCLYKSDLTPIMEFQSGVGNFWARWSSDASERDVETRTWGV